MGTETELKFEVAPQDLRKLKAAPALRRKPPKEENLISVYFDTPKHELARNGVSLRVRDKGDKRLQTVKSEGSDSSFRRGEWLRILLRLILGALLQALALRPPLKEAS